MANTLTAGQHKYYGPIVDKIRGLKHEIIGIYMSAKANQDTSEQIGQSLRLRVFDTPRFTKLPRPYREEIKGYAAGCGDLYFHNNIEWALWYDGKYIGHSKREREASDAMYKNPDFDGNKVKGHHVYIGTQKIFF